ncbi:MAG: M28 family peptidase [Deltaproteobacteria bacterium]|nr:M28 family peptidase [Candidatus Zymogenaceae bacterium]
MTTRVNDAGVGRVLALVGEIIERFGPRVAGTEACRQAADDIGRRLEPLCDTIGRQEFTVHAGPMRHLGHVIGGCYIFAVAMMWAGGAWVWGAAAAGTVSLVYWIIVSVLMVGALDFLFPGRQGVNVWGVIDPEGEVKRQVYVVGHHDSAYVLTFLGRFQKWYAVRIIGAIVFSTTIWAAAWAWVIWRHVNGADPVWGWVAAAAGVIGLVFVGPFVWFIGRTASPGAGDNLVASAMGVEIARIIRGKSGNGRLRHTRLVVLSLDGEEPGMRGAGAYLRAHAREMKRVQTSVFNIDAIYGIEDLRFLTRDRNGFKALSARMTAQCVEIGKRLGYTIAAGPVTFGGGGTDAVRFADYGIEVASIIGISTDLIREGLVYHTVNDTVEKLDPKAVRACMEIAVNYIKDKDEQE